MALNHTHWFTDTGEILITPMNEITLKDMGTKNHTTTKTVYEKSIPWRNIDIDSHSYKMQHICEANVDIKAS